MLSSAASANHASTDLEIWSNLRQAIASSSGFHRWQLEHNESCPQETNLDHQVRRYLRETLETLAY